MSFMQEQQINELKNRIAELEAENQRLKARIFLEHSAPGARVLDVIHPLSKRPRKRGK